MSSTLSLVDRCATILRSAPCQKIDFWLGGLHVSGVGFTMIAHALCKAGGGADGISIALGDIPKDAEASYDQITNTIHLPSLEYARTDPFQKLVIVHEATHALRDSHGAVLVYGGRKFRPRSATDEAAAYVAGCLFDVYTQEACGGEISDSPEWLAARKSPIHAVAYAVALRQARRPAGSAVERSDLSLLFASVSASMRKRGTPNFFDYDGLPK